MTDPRETLARIRAQADAATEGPWTAEYSGEQGNCVLPPGYQSTREAVAVTRLLSAQADAEFIAASRTDVPWLLEQVELRDKVLEAVLEKVLRLHPRVVVLHADPEFGRMEDDAICGACIVNHEPADWPCPTVAAITTTLEGETRD